MLARSDTATQSSWPSTLETATAFSDVLPDGVIVIQTMAVWYSINGSAARNHTQTQRRTSLETCKGEMHLNAAACLCRVKHHNHLHRVRS